MFSAEKIDPTPIPPEFWRCCGSEERRPKLITRVINFELTQHIRPRTVQTDERTDGRLTIAIPR